MFKMKYRNLPRCLADDIHGYRRRLFLNSASLVMRQQKRKQLS